MSRNRNLFAWSLALVSGLAFAAGAGYPQAAQFLRQGIVATALAQDPVPTTPPQQQQQQDPEAGRGGPGRGGQAQAPRPYASVITSAMKSDDGVFKVHRGMVGGTDTIYF